MTRHAEDVLEVVRATLDELVANASTDIVRKKLRGLDEACRHMVVTAGQRLTVPAVLKAYAARVLEPTLSLAESSIRNKRDGANPYHALYRAWESAAEVLAERREYKRLPAAGGEILSPRELGGIADPALRHQVALVLAQNTSLKRQNDMLKQVRGAPMIRIEGSGSGTQPESVPVPALDETELDSIRDFLDERKLKARRLRISEDGAVQTPEGRSIADPGFVDALRKLLTATERAGRV